MVKNVKFYDDIEENGVIIDWQLVAKEYKKLKIPQDMFNPLSLPLSDKIGYYILLSERATGKTTNLLLLAMVLNKLYGCTCAYIRTKKNQIKASTVNSIFDTIVKFEGSRYIRTLTDGVYNSIKYHWAGAYYTEVDENAQTTKTAEKPFMRFLDVDDSFDYKSGLNMYRPNIIIYDEFISDSYAPSNFCYFLDLHNTIGRNNKGIYTFMLSNTIDLQTPWFREFGIYNDIKKMVSGEHRIITTDEGTNLYLELIKSKTTTKRQTAAQRYYGFKNPQLNAIKGSSTPWAVKSYPHIKHFDDEQYITRDIHLRYFDELLQLDLMCSEELGGFYVNCHRCTSLYPSSVILVNDEINSPNEFFGKGRGKVFKLIWELRDMYRWFYDDNETANIVKNFLADCNKKLW